MFSATKFVVAGAIVALFGGFLLAGMLTTSQEDEMAPAAVTDSPTPTILDELPPGVDLVTEEVEPGVERIVSDGVRYLSGVGRWEDRDLAIAPDGAVWLDTGRLVKLGDPDSFSKPPTYELGLQVSPDGALWATGHSGSILRLGDDGWSEMARVDADYPVWDMAADGTVWGALDGADVARLDASGWREHPIDLDSIGLDLRQLNEDQRDNPDTARAYFEDLAVDANGDVWAALDVTEADVPMVLLRHDGEAWSLVDPLRLGGYYTVDLLGSGADGTMWVYLETGTDATEGDPHHLARLADGRWTVFSEEDGVPRLLWRGDNKGLLRVDRDGAVWVTPEGLGSCQGLRAFDGNTWRHYLDGHCLLDIEVAPDGRMWVLTEGSLYRITPEVAAAAEPGFVEPVAEAEPTGSSTTTPDLLPGVDLVTEEVEPGVFRVLGDGTDTAMDLSLRASDPGTTKVVAGQDGSVWIFEQGRLYRLGRPDFVNAAGLHEYWPDISVAPDGVVWAVSRPATDGPSGPAGNQLWSLADGRWTQYSVPEGTLLTDIETPADGSVWAGLATGDEHCGPRSVARLVDGAWQQEVTEPVSPSAGRGSLAVWPNGTVLLGTCGAGQLLERGEDGWVPSPAFDDSRAADFEFVWPVAMGRDGMAWANVWGRGGSRLAHRTDGDWEIIGDDGSVPMLFGPQVWELNMTVSDDGRLWVAFDDPPVALADNRDYSNDSGNNYLASLGSGCPGAISFDGTTWSQHLAGACVTHVSAAPDGNVWATVVESRAFAEFSLDPARAPTGLYVITPEAVAGTE